MFDIFAMLLSSIATFLFPVFASYKALNTSDPALLKPWLMYWVVLACGLLVESWFSFILVWIPLYPWARALFLLYLIAPQTQGARMLYETHLHPFLHEHERTIDDFITAAHARVRASSLSSLASLLALLKSYLLGLPPQQQQQQRPAGPASSTSYAQSLLARFNLPAAGPAAPASASADFYSLLASAVAAATSSSAAATAPALVPPAMRGPERASFISAQRERLNFLLSALDREAEAPRDEGQAYEGPRGGVPDNGEALRQRRVSGTGLPKSRSEVDFENIDAREAREEGPGGRVAGWMPWSWRGLGS